MTLLSPRAFLERLPFESKEITSTAKTHHTEPWGVCTLSCVHVTCRLIIYLKKLSTILVNFVLGLEGYF